MSKICVLIRVYNRIEDLKYCVDIIRDTWKQAEYHLIVVSNGREDGYVVDDSTKEKIDRLIEIKNNIGHFKGNSQLLLAGLPYIPQECDYTIILEADTWLYNDTLIQKYITKLDSSKAVWASAQFFSYVRNLATDFAIVKTPFIQLNSEIFKFTGTPEYYVANFLFEKGYKFIYIRENMPVNTPKYIHKFPFAPTGRFFVFPDSKMVTHHVENLKYGMEEKKFHFNVIANHHYFPLSNRGSLKWTRIKMRVAITLSYIFPYKGWFFKTKENYPV